MSTDAPEEFEPEEMYIIPNPVVQDSEHEEPGEAEYHGKSNTSHTESWGDQSDYPEVSRRSGRPGICVYT